MPPGRWFRRAAGQCVSGLCAFPCALVPIPVSPVAALIRRCRCVGFCFKIKSSFAALIFEMIVNI